eukprot:TRINITY_DN106719_c0_g1_i1.p1 TRINITY_DN106719_c0_g1~~TRINITY_DN106719_c0_g1_i1.p1  ORF type:complete len:105 (+),score=8.64 TRINITY_DN106719_c0_g1_i1:3-317(+)
MTEFIDPGDILYEVDNSYEAQSPDERVDSGQSSERPPSQSQSGAVKDWTFVAANAIGGISNALQARPTLTGKRGSILPTMPTLPFSAKRNSVRPRASSGRMSLR